MIPAAFPQREAGNASAGRSAAMTQFLKDNYVLFVSEAVNMLAGPFPPDFTRGFPLGKLRGFRP